jgi:multidrug efflux pump subunit AcrA (membrane-fusion protein)
MVNEDYAVLGERIMAQALFRLAAPTAVPPRPKAPGRLILIDPPSRRRHGVIVWLSVLAVALGAAAVWWASFARPAGAGASPRTARAEIGRVEQTLRVTGTISADHRGTLVAPYMIGNRHASGGTSFALILRKLAPSGSRVKKGDVIAEFDRETMLNRLEDYRAWVRQHQLNLSVLGARLDIRRQAFRQSILVAKARMDKAALDLNTIPVRSAIRAEQLRLTYEEAQSSYNERVGQSQNYEDSEAAALRRSQLDLQNRPSSSAASPATPTR